MARWRIRQINTLWIPSTWAYRWLESKNVLNSHKSNNHPGIIANFYLNYVAELWGCPVKLRTDCGTENGVMAAVQCTVFQLRRWRSQQVWVISVKPKDRELLGVLQKKKCLTALNETGNLLRFKWHASGFVLLNYFKIEDDLHKVKEHGTHI